MRQAPLHGRYANWLQERYGVSDWRTEGGEILPRPHRKCQQGMRCRTIAGTWDEVAAGPPGNDAPVGGYVTRMVSAESPQT
jgi:hypothetical protein